MAVHHKGNSFFLLVFFSLLLISLNPAETWALASNNIPLDSPVYFYLEKLAGFGLVKSDFRGIRPFTRAEAAKLLMEAELAVKERQEVKDYVLVTEATGELRRYLAREYLLLKDEAEPPALDYGVSGIKLRTVWLDGVPRSYERPVHDPGNEGVFGIGSGLRPSNPYPSLVHQRGGEGTPLSENNEGIVYSRGGNVDLRASGEVYAWRYLAALVEPHFLYSEGDGTVRGRLNKVYAKLGGGAVELEAGRDANWLGLGYRGNITLTNNAANFDLVKLSSPEPVKSKYLWDLKYALIVSRFDKTVTDGIERRPFFVAAKLSMKPASNLEAGINIGKQVGGPGVNNSLGSTLRGIFGGTSDDNANTIGGAELRIRLPFLRNTEVFGEFSGEDSASFWPIVESYVAGFYIPRLTEDGRNDLRFEYFLGNRILYTSGTFPGGYAYRGMPIGHSQGGATQEFFFRYGHYFSLRNRVAMEYFLTQRGKLGRIEGQAVERKNALRAFWNLPVDDELDLGFMYGWEWIENFNLVGGADRTNQLFRVELAWRY